MVIPQKGRVFLTSLLAVTLMVTSGLFLPPLIAPQVQGHAALSQRGDLGQPIVLPSPLHGSTPTASAPGTWSWFNLTSRYPVSPSPRLLGSMSIDPANGYSLLYGGIAPRTFAYLNDTWNFTRPGGWTERFSQSGPQLGRWGQMMAYDGNSSDRNPVMMYGGCTTGNGCPYNGYWTYDDTGAWAALTSPAGALMLGGLAYYAPAGDLILFGGCSSFTNVCANGALSQATWTYSGGTWTQLVGGSAPTAREAFGMVYDPALGKVILYGGNSATGLQQDTWAYSKVAGWTNVTSTLTGAGPGPRSNMLMQWDNQSHSIVLFGGMNAAGAALGDTWTFNGTAWVQIPPITAPSPRWGASSATLGDGTVTLFGGALNVNTGYNSTWILDGPLNATLSSDRRSLDLGQSFNLTATATGGVAPYTWSYQNLPSGCLSSNSTTLLCKPTSTGTYSIKATAVDRLGLTNVSTAVPVTVLNAPFISSFTASPATLALGGTTYLNVTVTGGTPPYSYYYTGLPPGCTTANLSSLACTPSVTGTFSVTVTVNDSAGKSTSQVASFKVTPPPPLTITSFIASPATITQGGTTYLNVSASGGLGPYRYSYTGLPSGCSSANTPLLACVPTVTGTFPVTVTVTDPASQTASAKATFTVTPVLGITSFTALPATIPLGGTVYLNVTATGGTSPYTYFYSGLSPGCASSNTARLVCVPAVAGTFSGRVTVTDVYGNTATATATFTVRSPSGLAISSYTALPSTIPLGGTVYLNVTATGGTPSYTYAYSGLPPGCSSASSPAYTCVPATTGTFTVIVTVTDSAANSVYGSASFTVHAVNLTIASFTASPATIPLGGTTYLNVTVSGGTPGYIFVYNNLPAGCTSSSTASLACAPSAAGTYNTVTVTVTDARSNSVTSNPVAFSVAQPGGPSISAFTALPSTLYVGATLYLNTTATGGTSPYTYVYNNLPAGCTSSSTPALTCLTSTVGTFSISVTVTDKNSVSTTSAPSSVTVLTLPAISAFTVSPSTIPFGGTTYLNVTASGGVTPYTYAYAGLPTGCPSSSTAKLVCAPAVSGYFNVTVTVTDTNGRSVTSTRVPLHVVSPPGPFISAFSASPSTIPFGGTTYVNVTATGGTPPYSYAYSGLPTGCSSLSTPALVCTPAVSGNFNVTVTVTDASSQSVTSAPAPITVAPPPAPTIISFGGSPPTFYLGGATYLNVTATGGTLPYSYAYANLPTGCASSSTASLPCVPTASGTYAGVTVTVTGANSISVTGGPIVVTVLSLPSISSFTASPAVIPLGGTTYLNVTPAGGVAPYSYTYTNLPTGCSTSNVTSLLCAPSATGAYSTATVTVFDANGKSATSQPISFTVTTTGSLLAIGSFTVSPATVPMNGTTYVNVTATGGSPAYTYLYMGLPGGCLTSDAPKIACSPSSQGTFNLSVQVTDVDGTTVTSSPEQLIVTPPVTFPSILTFTATPASIPIGGTSYLDVSVSGGNLPYAYSYLSLPPGCPSSNGPKLACSPTAIGTFYPVVRVTDQNMHVVSSTTTLTVTGSPNAPTITSFAASPNPVVVNHTTVLTVVVAGGNSPYSYAYTGLPAGCSSRDAATVSCTPTTTGNFVVKVTITDAAGRYASSTTTLEVQPSSQPGSLVGSSWFLLALLGAIVVIVALLILVAFRRRKRPTAATPAASAAAPVAVPGTITMAPPAAALVAPQSEWDESDDAPPSGIAKSQARPNLPPSPEEEWSEDESPPEPHGP